MNDNVVSLNPSEALAPHHYPSTCPRALDLSSPSHQDLTQITIFKEYVTSIFKVLIPNCKHSNQFSTL